LEVAEECGETEVVKRRYRPWDGWGVMMMILRLRGSRLERDAHVSGDIDLDGPSLHRAQVTWMR